jgi:PPK2 family polyphosphate:nucleotide phosphotransferase
MDASGKDGTVKAVIGPLNPIGVRVAAFKAPTSQELAHDFLWRIAAELPERGQVGVFNRSHYEDVLIVRVEELVPEEVWRPRYDAIAAWERNLVNEGTTIVKCFLNLSKDEQRKRFQERLEDPAKHWKANAEDLAKRDRWDDYQVAYREMLERTSTEWAPWHVIPADRKWVRNVVIAELIGEALEDMDLAWPALDSELEGVTVG